MNTKIFSFAKSFAKSFAYSVAVSMITMCSSTAWAQLYYIPFELDFPPEVNRLGLGYSLGVDANKVYIGDIGNRFLPDTTPSAVYQYDLNTFSILQTYSPVGHPWRDLYGYSLEYYDGVLLVGAVLAENDFGFRRGKAYLISPVNGSILHTFDENTNSTNLSNFGYNLSINDVAVVIGATGYNPDFAGRVFVYNAANNALVTSLIPEPGTGDTNYGQVVDHNDDYLVVSAPGSRFDAIGGAVYVYDFVTGELLHRITPPAPDPNGAAHFGVAMDLEGDKLLIGSGDFAPDGLRSKVFVYDLTTGAVDATLTNDSGTIFDRFGQSISVEGNIAVISASYDSDVGPTAGAVYIFDLNTYEMIDKVYPTNVTRHRSFGRQVKIQDGTILATSFLNNTGNLDDRAVHVLYSYCKADINLDGMINFFDVSAMLKFAVDFDQNGVFNFFDISSFLQSYQSDCP